MNRPMRVAIVTLDNHLAGCVANAEAALQREIPGFSIAYHASSGWESDPRSLERCRADIAQSDIIIVTMMFIDDHIRAIQDALEARRESCDALVVAMSAGEVVKLTKLGDFSMNGPAKGPLALLKRLRGSKSGGSSGAKQMAVLRRLPKILRFIPGKAQDVRAYFLTLQYWLAGSEANVINLVKFLINRYADGPRAHLRGTLSPDAPVEHPDMGVYHPRMQPSIETAAARLPKVKGATGTVGLVLLRSYLLANDSGHYDGVIAALEAQGLNVIPVFASGLDARPAIEAYFMRDGRPTVDAMVSLTGFSLVGGPAYNDAEAAEAILAKLSIPYISAQAVEFQSLEAWCQSSAGLTPVESTIMVAIPELDGAVAPIVYGGRANGCCHASKALREALPIEAAETTEGPPKMRACDERAATLAARVAKLVRLRQEARAKRRIALVLFDFPPNAGAAGSAAYLSVFESVFNTLNALKAGGYDVDVPGSVDELKTKILEGNSGRYGTDANVHALIPVDDHIRREPHLAEIEAQWGSAPGRQLTDGRSIFIQGAEFGNVFIGLQPAFGYEGDPMRLLFEAGFSPTHAFSCFYRYLREDFDAHAILHFGTHGALEFMPGKQVGLSGRCWPERLIGDAPNFYFYAANNPSEGAVARRRSGATLISYLTPPVSQSGLYKGLLDLKETIDHWRSIPPEEAQRGALLQTIIEQARAVELEVDEAVLSDDPEAAVAALSKTLSEVERTLIPEGLHVIGAAPTREERAGYLAAIAESRLGEPLDPVVIEAVLNAEPAERAAGAAGRVSSPELVQLTADLIDINRRLGEQGELDSLFQALDGGYVRPAPGGDLIRNPDILPTGRNLHGFDPFRLPTAFAVKEGARQAARILERHLAEASALPESVAFVLWGTDNLKSGGGPIAQVLALMGARPRMDSYGRLAGAELIPLAELGRPRIDVVITLSGIFRDLLPLQIRMLAEAAYLAASADEPDEQNYIAKHAKARAAETGCDLETASLRVFSNADGAYGANVNQMIDDGRWNDADELADVFEARKCFAFGRNGKSARQPEEFAGALKHVDMTYQNLDSLELGVTTVDHYVDMLGGVSRAARRARGADVPVYVGDQTQGEGKVRSLAEQVRLETFTRTLNPRWYEGLLRHGYEGVRNIEVQVTNTMGWSATTGDVDPWVYQKISETFVLDEEMRRRLAELNPKASVRMANRLMEAHERDFWSPDAATLEALRKAGDELEDRLEGVAVPAE